ncbi:MAG TPA: efflux transporter outer membrane subunit [Pirellulales bacterium]|jgi:NodT family efflux transporter outer membrane factor (OMF) lipoprotein
MEAGKPSQSESVKTAAGRPTERSRRALSSFLLLLICAITGCTSLREYVGNGFKVGPNYKRPPAPVASEWIDADDKRVRSQESEEIAHWWNVFRDPVLDELVADAYRQNLTLREAGFRILQARANYGYAVGTFFPQQQYMSGDYLRNAISTEAANRPFVLQRFYNQNDLGFTLAWELDFWGRYRRAIEAADAELNASVEDYDDVMVTLLGDIATAYVNMRIYEAQIAYTQANVQLQQQTLTIATARFKGGLVTELDVDQAQSILSQTEAQIPQLEISLRLATNNLCVLLGLPTEDLRKRMRAMPIPTTPVEVAVGIPADLLRRRPDVRRAERHAAAQAARIGIAESDFYPHISINGTITGQAANFNDLLNSKALQGGVGPGFQWNLLNYGRILNNVRAQDALFQQLVVHYQQTVLTADQEAENGLVMFLRSQEQARYMAESVAAAQRAVVIAVAQYKGGLVDFNRVSLVEQNLVTQQNSYAQAFGAIASGLVQTYRALGGGWEIRLDPQAALLPGLPPPQPKAEMIPPPAGEPAMKPNPPAGAAPQGAPPEGPALPPGLPQAGSGNPPGAPPQPNTVRFVLPGNAGTPFAQSSVPPRPVAQLGPPPAYGPEPPGASQPVQADRAETPVDVRSNQVTPTAWGAAR